MFILIMIAPIGARPLSALIATTISGATPVVMMLTPLGLVLNRGQWVTIAL